MDQTVWEGSREPLILSALYPSLSVLRTGGCKSIIRNSRFFAKPGQTRQKAGSASLSVIKLCRTEKAHGRIRDNDVEKLRQCRRISLDSERILDRRVSSTLSLTSTVRRGAQTADPTASSRRSSLYLDCTPSKLTLTQIYHLVPGTPLISSTFLG